MSFFGEDLYNNARKKKLHHFNQFNKNYYKLIEDYDWIEATNSFSGPETFYHRLRKKIALEYISDYLKKNNKGKILDAGCGTGLILKHLPKNSIGIDINPRHIKKAKINSPKSVVLLRDIEKTGLKSNSFDLVVCFETLEHLVFPERALKEFMRLIKKDGQLIGSVPRRTILWLLRNLSFSHPHNEPFHREFDQKELKNLLMNYFEIEQIRKEIFGFNFFFVAKPKKTLPP